jgi:tetratricopeptide (TPR) repeat protein
MAALRQNFYQAMRRRAFAEAEDVLARMTKEAPLSAETRGSELELFLESGRLSEAGSLAGQLCRTFPESARILFLAGKVFYRLKDYETAAENFRESRRLHPGPQVDYWLGKTLTQSGRYDEAESLLQGVREQNPWALLELGWLNERRGDLDAALRCCEEFLRQSPGHPFASRQQVRIKARMLDPEALIEEAEALAGYGERVPDSIFPEFVERLFETGQAPRARDEIRDRIESLEARESVRVAWICYRHQAFDLAATTFLAQLRPNVSNYKYLAALEAAARKCGRLAQVIAAYRPLCAEARHLYGRVRLLSK